MLSYLPIGIFLAIALAIVPGVMVLGWFVRPRKYDPVKMAPYECGIEVHDAPKGKVSVHFYLVAVVFLVFDVETIFLLPWAVSFDRLKLFGFIEVVLFLALLVAAYVYVWMKGALRWEE